MESAANLETLRIGSFLSEKKRNISPAKSILTASQAGFYDDKASEGRRLLTC